MSFRNLLDPPAVGPLLPGWLRGLKEVVNNILRGKLNNTGTVTLTPSAITTTITDNRIGGSSTIHLQPTTANAAAALATTYPSTPGAGTVVINHANDAQVDKTFLYAILG